MKKISRRSFLRNIAAAGSGAAALGLLAGCSSSSTAASSGSTAAASFPIYIVINIIVHFPGKGNAVDFSFYTADSGSNRPAALAANAGKRAVQNRQRVFCKKQTE